MSLTLRTYETRRLLDTGELLRVRACPNSWQTLLEASARVNGRVCIEMLGGDLPVRYAPGAVVACREKWRCIAWNWEDGEAQIQYEDMSTQWRGIGEDDFEPWIHRLVDAVEKLPSYKYIDNSTYDGSCEFDHNQLPWRSAATMPAWAVRPEFQRCVVKGAEVKLVQDVTEEEAIAAGVRCWVCNGPIDGSSENDCACFHTKNAARDSFEVAWDYGDYAHAVPGRWWADNPYVECVTIQRGAEGEG